MPGLKTQCRKCHRTHEKHLNNEQYDEFMHECKGIVPCVYCGWKVSDVIKTKANIRDGFTPGYYPNLGKVVRTKGQYYRELKRQGLELRGNESLPVEPPYSIEEAFTDEDLKEFHDRGLQVSGREAEYLKSQKMKIDDLTPEEIAAIESGEDDSTGWEAIEK